MQDTLLVSAFHAFHRLSWSFGSRSLATENFYHTWHFRVYKALNRRGDGAIAAIGSVAVLLIVLVTIFYAIDDNAASLDVSSSSSSDEMIIEKVEEYAEAQAFVKRYPEAQPIVSKELRLTVEYEASRSSVTGIGWNATAEEPRAVLSFSLDDNLVVDYIAFACLVDGRVTVATTEGIEEYLSTATTDCWDDEGPQSNERGYTAEGFMS